MQTCKSRHGLLDVPDTPSLVAPHTTRKHKTTGSDSSHMSICPNPVKKPPKVRCPKISGDPQIPAKEKKQTGRVSELESQITQLHVELTNTKDQLQSAESLKMKAQQEAEDASKQVLIVSATLEETRKQLKELSDSEDARVQELCKISHDRDRAWQAELEAVNKHRSIDSAALASARNETQWLKLQLVRVSESEASHARHAELARAEIQSLRLELVEALELVENVKTHFERDSVMESSKSLVLELKQSKSRINSLEELVDTLQTDSSHAYELVESVKSESSQKELELKGKLEESLSEVETLRTKLIELEHLPGENTEVFPEKGKRKLAERESESALEDLKGCLLEKERQLQIITDENERLKYKIVNWEIERSIENDEAISAEQETMVKLQALSEEADESSREAGRVVEELNATRASNVEMEGEVRRLKVQMDQWRKAAEVAAAMLSSENRDKCTERTALYDYNTLGGKLGVPYLEETDHESPDKRNTNVLRKIGSLLKKGQK